MCSFASLCLLERFACSLKAFVLTARFLSLQKETRYQIVVSASRAVGPQGQTLRKWGKNLLAGIIFYKLSLTFYNNSHVPMALHFDKDSFNNM